MSKIQKLLEDKNDLIDYDKIIQKYPWILKENINCIISPDSDGLLSALFMSYYLKWNVIGFYDGKVMLIKDGHSCFNENTVFLDMEVCRRGVRSIGHHMLRLNFNAEVTNNIWSNFENCIQPNNLRGYDGKHYFRLKYPLATIHLLLGILSSKFKIELTKDAICPLFFVDGTFKVLYSYPENVLNWLHYLRFSEDNNALRYIFLNDHYTVYSQIIGMDNFFRKRDEISVPNERGDRLRISRTDGSPYNVRKNNYNLYDIDSDAKLRIIKFINLLSSLAGWSFNESKWSFTDFKLFKFTKSDFKNRRWNINNTNFSKLLNLNPLSWAMTSGENIEFTEEKPDKLP